MTQQAAGVKDFESVFRSADLCYGIYRCNHRNRAIGAEQFTRSHTINFPLAGMYLKHVCGREVVVDPNHAVFFNARETYRTSHPDGCGDFGTYIVLSQQLLADLAGAADPALADRLDQPFTHSHQPLSAGTFVAQRRLFEAVIGPTPPDAMEIGERLLGLAARVLREGDPAAARRRSSMSRQSSRAHRDLAVAALELIGMRFREALTIDDIALAVGSSPHHLCRVFRDQTGTSLHAYREQLRLREAWNHLRDPHSDLTGLALRLGYSSHSHFTARFRRAFGIAPSAARRRESLTAAAGG